MYGEKDKRQIKSNNKLDQHHEVENRRDSEHCAHAALTPERLEFLRQQNRDQHSQARAVLTPEQFESLHNPLKLTQDELNEFNDLLGRPSSSKNPSIFEINAGVNSEYELQASREHQCLAHVEITSNQLDLSQQRLMSNDHRLVRQCQQERHRCQQQSFREYRHQQNQLQHRSTQDELNPKCKMNASSAVSGDGKKRNNGSSVVANSNNNCGLDNDDESQLSQKKARVAMTPDEVDLESHSQAHDELTPEQLALRQQQDRDRFSLMERYYGL